MSKCRSHPKLDTLHWQESEVLAGKEQFWGVKNHVLVCVTVWLAVGKHCELEKRRVEGKTDPARLLTARRKEPQQPKQDSSIGSF